AIDVSASTPATYTITYTTAGTCPNSASVSVTVNAEPTTAASGTEQTICTATATLGGNSPSNGTGIWSTNGGATITSPSSPTSTVTDLDKGTNTFTWTISNGTCSSSSSEVIITYNLEADTPGLINGPASICPSLSNIAYSIDPVPNATSYTWSFSSSAATITGNGSTVSIDFDASFSGGTLSVIANSLCDPSTASTLVINLASPETCELASCLRDNIYIDDELLAINQATEVFKASNNIESSATINAGNNLIFKAGNTISIYLPFTVEDGGLFIAEIEACILAVQDTNRK
ncbi:MAG: hypothetical protein ACJA01_001526, partial [Saprospiraceae bacterium]